MLRGMILPNLPSRLPRLPQPLSEDVRMSEPLEEPGTPLAGMYAENGTTEASLCGRKWVDDYAGLVRRQLELLGEDPEREGLLRTPERVARAMKWLTRGYRLTLADVVGEGVFEDAHQNMVMVRDIELYSLCEHHLLPFFGKAHIAYIPAGRLLGLSKLPRIVDMFARRLQVQERLTSEIADAVQEAVQPRGVGVVIEAYHLCMMMRGVEKQNSKTITSALLGSFRDDAKTRDEFLRLAHSPSRLME